MKRIESELIERREIRYGETKWNVVYSIKHEKKVKPPLILLSD